MENVSMKENFKHVKTHFFHQNIFFSVLFNRGIQNNYFFCIIILNNFKVKLSFINCSSTWNRFIKEVILRFF